MSMQPKTNLYLKVLLNRYNPVATEAYLKAMPKEEIKPVISQNVPSNDPTLIYKWPEEEINLLHYSWLAPVMQKMAPFLQSSVLASLSPAQRASLSKYLNIPQEATSLSNESKAFFLSLLWQQWPEKPDFPIQYLPPSSLNALISLNKSELVELIDFLAMYDLAESIRHIVDKKSLKTIYDCLHPKKQQFLRICLHQQEKVAAPKLELNKWDGNAKKLEEMLHRRGLFRIGKALAGQNLIFVKRIAHTLDSGRGSILLKYYSPNEIPGITQALVQQTISVINFIKKKSEP